MELSLLDIVSFFAVFVSLLLAFFLLTNKSEIYTSNLLIALFLIFNAQDLSQLVKYFVYPHYPGLGMLLNSTVFLIAPLIYLYFQSIIFSDFRLKPRDLLHLIPFLLVILMMIPGFYTLGWEEKLAYLQGSGREGILEIKIGYLLLHAQIAGYILVCFLSIRKYKKLLLENYSDANMFHYRWLYQLLLLYGLTYLLGFIKNVFLFLELEEVFAYSMMAGSLFMLGFICWLVLNALRSPRLFVGIDSNLQLVRDMAFSPPQPEPLQAEPEREDLEIQRKIQALQKHMQAHKPYLDPSLSVHKLAIQLDVSHKELSLLINRHLNMHFFDFVNGYRIREAMQILQDPQRNELTVLEILYEVGFNSKSSFNTAFKKYTRLTPTQYRKKHLLLAA